VIDGDAAHQDDLHGPRGPRRLDRPAHPLDGSGDQISGAPEDPLQAGGVTETRDDRVAALDLAGELLVTHAQDIGLDHGQVRVARGVGREALGGTDHGSDADAAAEQLLEHAATSAARAAEEQDAGLRGRGDGFHHPPFGYWNTSSSGTSNTRAI
jgi:hypothetical protein